MIYFSELKGKTAVTEDGVEIGILDDIIFLATESPKVTKLLIIDKRDRTKKFQIPFSCVKKINRIIKINKNFITEELVDNEIYVLRNLLDKQIIDLVGSKLVRVNDVVLQEEDGYYIAGVDVGYLAILRWLGLEKLALKSLSLLRIKYIPTFLSWGDVQPLELTRGLVKLKKKEEKLEQLKPEDLAFYLDRTNIRNVGRILALVDEKRAASVIGSLNLNYQGSLFRYFPIEKAVKIISLMDPDEAVDVILTLTRKRRDEIINNLDKDKKQELNYLMGLSKTPIGDILTTEYITVLPSLTKKQVIESIKKNTADFFYLNVIYVTNENNKLLGVFNLHELIMHDDDTPVYKFMIQKVIVTHLTTPEEIVLKKIIKYHLHSLPVVDSEGKVLGMVTLDDVAKSIWEKKYEKNI